jgi:hypothetical protein
MARNSLLCYLSKSRIDLRRHLDGLVGALIGSRIFITRIGLVSLIALITFISFVSFVSCAGFVSLILQG